MGSLQVRFYLATVQLPHIRAIHVFSKFFVMQANSPWAIYGDLILSPFSHKTCISDTQPPSSQSQMPILIAAAPSPAETKTSKVNDARL